MVDLGVTPVPGKTWFNEKLEVVARKMKLLE
jgi:hypothetical protein